MGHDGLNTSNILMNRINEFIKTADKKGNNDGKIDNDETNAILYFKEIANNAYKNGIINDETLNYAMGLYVTSPIGNNAPETISAYTENEAYKIAKDGVNDLVNGKNKLQISYELKDEVTLDNIVEKLNAHFVNLDDYKAYEELNDLVEKINNAELTNKDDVKKLKKDLKKDGLTKFQKDVLDDFMKLAEQQVVINNEYTKLVEYYENIKDGRTEGLNYSAMKRDVKKHFKDDKFYKASWKMFDDYVKNDSRNFINAERNEDIAEGSTSTTKKAVKKDIKNEVQDGDRITKKQARKDDTGNEVQARIQKRDRRREELKNISLSEIESGLDKDTYNLLVRTGYLKEHKLGNGNYDLSAISDAISAGVGADVLMNDHNDNKLSEMDEVKENLRKLLNNTSFVKNSTVHDLREFCHIDKDTRDRSVIVPTAAVGGAAGGALAAIDRPLEINVKNYSNFEIDLGLLSVDDNTVNDLVNSLTNQGATVIQDGTSIKIDVTNINKLLINQDWTEILAGAGIGLATSLALQLIIGTKKDEKSCWDMSNFNPTKNNYKTFEEFKSFVKQNEPVIADAIIAWATPYYQKDSVNWNTNFYADLLKIAGNEILNCEEIRAAQMSKPVDNSRRATIETKTTNDEISDCIIYKRKANDTWASIVRTYYPELEKEYGLYGANGAIRKLKVALATENGVLNQATYNELLQATDLPKEICLPQCIAGKNIKADAFVPEQTVISEDQMAKGEDYHAPLKFVGSATVVKVGETTYIARDCQDTSITASGSSKEDALNKLKEITKVERYDNEDELLK